MCYSIGTRDRRYVKGYKFLSIAKTIGKNISNKYIVHGIGGVWVSKKGQLMLYIVEKLIYWRFRKSMIQKHSQKCQREELWLS